MYYVVIETNCKYCDEEILNIIGEAKITKYDNITFYELTREYIEGWIDRIKRELSKFKGTEITVYYIDEEPLIYEKLESGNWVRA